MLESILPSLKCYVDKCEVITLIFSAHRTLAVEAPKPVNIRELFIKHCQVYKNIKSIYVWFMDELSYLIQSECYYSVLFRKYPSGKEKSLYKFSIDTV